MRYSFQDRPVSKFGPPIWNCDKSHFSQLPCIRRHNSVISQPITMKFGTHTGGAAGEVCHLWLPCLLWIHGPHWVVYQHWRWFFLNGTSSLNVLQLGEKWTLNPQDLSVASTNVQTWTNVKKSTNVIKKTNFTDNKRVKFDKIHTATCGLKQIIQKFSAL